MYSKSYISKRNKIFYYNLKGREPLQRKIYPSSPLSNLPCTCFFNSCYVVCRAGILCLLLLINVDQRVLLNLFVESVNYYFSLITNQRIILLTIRFGQANRSLDCLCKQGTMLHYTTILPQYMGTRLETWNRRHPRSPIN